MTCLRVEEVEQNHLRMVVDPAPGEPDRSRSYAPRGTGASLRRGLSGGFGSGRRRKRPDSAHGA